MPTFDRANKVGLSVRPASGHFECCTVQRFCDVPCWPGACPNSVPFGVRQRRPWFGCLLIQEKWCGACDNVPEEYRSVVYLMFSGSPIYPFSLGLDNVERTHAAFDRNAVRHLHVYHGTMRRHDRVERTFDGCHVDDDLLTVRIDGASAIKTDGTVQNELATLGDK